MAMPFSTIDGLKRAAKKLKRATNMTHAQSLDHVAREGGFQNFTHASRNVAAENPTQHFPVTISKYWFNQKSKTHCAENLTIYLSQPLTGLVKHRHLEGYLAGVQLLGEDHLYDYDACEDQDHARKLACRLARALQFMDATGLKPSVGKRVYPKNDWYNRPPGVDHDKGWYDPRTKTYLFTDEPYGIGEQTQAERTIWCKRHGFEIVRSSRASIYGYGTELYLIAKRGTALNLKILLAKLDVSAPPILEDDWNLHAKR